MVYRWFGQEAPQVLATQGWATAALLVVIVWKYFGFHMALFVAGRQGIGDEVLEAAKIDGANRWQTTLNIVLPLMRPVAAVLSLFFSILGSMLSVRGVYVLEFAKLLRWRSPACPRVFSFVPTLPVSGRGGRALNLGNKAAEDP